MISNGELRLNLDLDDIRKVQGPTIGEDILRQPQKAIASLRGILNRITDNID